MWFPAPGQYPLGSDAKYSREKGTDCHLSIPQSRPLHPLRGRSASKMVLWSWPWFLILGMAKILSNYSWLLHLGKTPKCLHKEFPHLLIINLWVCLCLCLWCITCLMCSFGLKNGLVGGHAHPHGFSLQPPYGQQVVFVTQCWFS